MKRALRLIPVIVVGAAAFVGGTRYQAATRAQAEAPQTEAHPPIVPPPAPAVATAVTVKPQPIDDEPLVTQLEQGELSASQARDAVFANRRGAALIASLKRRLDDAAVSRAELLWYALGQAYIRQLMDSTTIQEKIDLSQKALDATEKAIELAPGFWEARYAKAENLSYWPVSTGGPTRAMRELESLIADQPSFEASYALLANLYLSNGLAGRAAQTAAQGLQRFPQSRPLADVAALAAER